MPSKKTTNNLDKLKDVFPAKDVIWRVQRSGTTKSGRWAMVLAYIDSRAVQDRLDEVCGLDGWQTDIQVLNDGVLAKISIKIGDTWVHKTDGSPQTAIEAFKGGISKAIVRCASQWGIGRYLYNLDATFAECTTDKPHDMTGWKQEYDREKNEKWYWKIPTLPDWALPNQEEERAELIHSIRELYKIKDKEGAAFTPEQKETILNLLDGLSMEKLHKIQSSMLRM